jgi:CheY-like chemotaxis protein
MNAPLPSESTPKKKILIVEDRADIRRLLVLTLSTSGYEVQEAADGLAAMTQLQAFAPDMIISDIDMPEMTGIEMARILRECKNFTPILFVSGSLDPATARAVAEITPHSLKKPALPSQVLEKVSLILSPAA